MTLPLTLPDRIPLDPPPGDPASVDDLTRRLGSAVFCLGVLETSLGGPATAAPGWIGDDAAATASRVAAVAALARDSTEALARAAGRLRAHRDLLEEVRDRIRALAAQQDDDYATAWGRLGALPDPATAIRSADPAAVAVTEDVAAAEATRRREHAALLEEVAADARATGHVLAECSAVVGGTGRPGDPGRVVAHLALALPEWGAAELAVRGEQLAAGLLGGGRPEEREVLAAGALEYAGNPAFARAFLAELGTEGVELLLLSLGSGQHDQDSPIAAVLAAALGAAAPSGPADPVGEVLTATYVRPDDRYGSSDVVAAGMAAVLASGGLRPETVARWAGQMLRREREQGLYAGSGAVPGRWDGALQDPAAVALAVLAGSGEPEPVASLLVSPEIWQTLLSRAWTDGGAVLNDTIAVIADMPAGIGDDVVRTGLAVIGAGLFEADPTEWTVTRGNVASAAPALADAVAAHVVVAVQELGAVVDVPRPGGASDALRGLGYLTVDPTASQVVGEALYGWAHGGAASTSDGDTVADTGAGIALPSAYLATQEYGQRLAHVLDTYEAQETAEHRQVAYQWSVALLPDVLPAAWRPVAEAIVGVGAVGLGADGTWEDPRDEGLVLDAGTAVADSLAGVGPVPRAELPELATRAREVYGRTAVALGDPVPVLSPAHDWNGLVAGMWLPEAWTGGGSDTDD